MKNPRKGTPGECEREERTVRKGRLENVSERSEPFERDCSPTKRNEPLRNKAANRSKRTTEFEKRQRTVGKGRENLRKTSEPFAMYYRQLGKGSGESEKEERTARKRESEKEQRKVRKPENLRNWSEPLEWD